MPLIFVVTLAVSLAMTPLVRRYAISRQWVDRPGEERRVHKVAVPRLGGVAMFAAFAVGVLSTFVFPSIRSNKAGNEQFETSRVLLLLLGAGIITAVMAVDDVRKLKALPRLIWQVGVALLVVLPSIFVPGSANPGDPAGTIHYDQGAGVLATTIQNPFAPSNSITPFIEIPLVLAALLTIFWLVGTTNAINWIDGLDGLAATVSAVAAASMFVATGPVLQQWSLSYLPLILLAAILGFLPFNIHPARIFMGDSGAMFLGFTLAVLSVIGGAKVAAALLVLGIPLLDGVYMIVYRIYRGRSPLSSDRGHLHHRLYDIGLSQGQIVMVYLVLCSVFGVIGALPLPRILKLIGIVVMALVLLGLFIYIARRQFDKGRKAEQSNIRNKTPDPEVSRKVEITGKQ